MLGTKIMILINISWNDHGMLMMPQQKCLSLKKILLIPINLQNNMKDLIFLFPTRFYGDVVIDRFT